MVVLYSILYMIAPIITFFALVLSIGLIKKNRMYIFILIALVLAIVAFYFNPRAEYDLYRYHKKMDIIRQLEFSEFKNFFVKNGEVEPIKILFMYIISKITNNNNFLQLIITFLGYSIIFYMINDYAKRNNIKNWIVLFNAIYLFFSLYYIDFISPLWNNIAIIIFALGVYLEYVKKKNKILCYIIYFSTILIHISMLVPILLKFLFSVIFKNKLKISNILVMATIIFIPEILSNILPKITNNYMILTIVDMYESYFVNGNDFDAMYGGKYLILTLAQICIYAFIYIKTENKQEIDNLTILYLISFVFLIINAEIFSRFILLVQLIGIPILQNYLNNIKYKNNINTLFTICLIIFTIVLAILRIRNFINLDLDFNNIFTEGITTNVFSLIINR